MLRSPSRQETAAWLDAGPPAIVTLAPELPGAVDAIAQLTAAGVVVSLGHSGADAPAAQAGLAAGARMATHLFNAMPPPRSRKPGPVLALLDDAGWDGLYDVEIFSDDGTFGAAYDDSLWAVPPNELLPRVRAAFDHVWDALTPHPPK
jgi:N-acetylglucosamine-6-phosphate deacetylase